MIKTSTALSCNLAYLEAQQPLSDLLKELVKAAFPYEYEVLEKTWEAGRWVGSPASPFLGEAIVWKYQVNLHKDPSDWGICLTTPSGAYEGGEAIFPDLKLKFS